MQLEYINVITFQKEKVPKPLNDFMIAEWKMIHSHEEPARKGGYYRKRKSYKSAECKKDRKLKRLKKDGEFHKTKDAAAKKLLKGSSRQSVKVHKFFDPKTTIRVVEDAKKA